MDPKTIFALMCLVMFAQESKGFVAELPAATICDARLFRQALVGICTFHRRDVNQNIYRYYYGGRDGGDQEYTEGHQHHDDPSIMSFAPLETETTFYSGKIRRHREFNLHRQCCLSGCTAMDFAGLC